MKISRLLDRSFIATLAVTVLIAAAMSAMFLESRKAIERADMYSKIRTTLLERLLLREDYLFTRSESSLAQIFEKDASLDEMFLKLRPNRLTDEYGALYEELITGDTNVSALFKMLLDSGQSPAHTGELSFMWNEDERQLLNQILIKAFIINEDARRLEKLDRANNARLNRGIVWLSVCCIAVLITLIALNRFFISKALTVGIERLRSGATSIGRGNFGTRLSLFPDDEISEVAREINAMAASLSNSFESIRKLEKVASRRNAQLEAANRELEAFAYSVAHDLRAPLRSIDGFASILLEDYGDALGDEGNRLLNIIKSCGMTMDRLTQDILDLTKVGKAELNLIRVDMRALAQESVALCAAPAELADFEISIAALPDALADRAMMQRVWENLLSNAVKYSKPSPVHRIEVRGIAQDGTSEYSVQDHGTGFDQRYEGKLFTIFQRLHDPEKFNGTGVGLSIVKTIVEKHGGRVWAEGRVGFGAKFSFSIPSEVEHG